MKSVRQLLMLTLLVLLVGFGQAWFGEQLSPLTSWLLETLDTITTAFVSRLPKFGLELSVAISSVSQYVLSKAKCARVEAAEAKLAIQTASSEALRALMSCLIAAYYTIAGLFHVEYHGIIFATWEAPSTWLMPGAGWSLEACKSGAGHVLQWIQAFLRLRDAFVAYVEELHSSLLAEYYDFLKVVKVGAIAVSAASPIALWIYNSVREDRRDLLTILLQGPIRRAAFRTWQHRNLMNSRQWFVNEYRIDPVASLARLPMVLVSPDIRAAASQTANLIKQAKDKASEIARLRAEITMLECELAKTADENLEHYRRLHHEDWSKLQVDMWATREELSKTQERLRQQEAETARYAREAEDAREACHQATIRMIAVENMLLAAGVRVPATDSESSVASETPKPVGEDEADQPHRNNEPAAQEIPERLRFRWNIPGPYGWS
ncbi:hypothetical protein BDY21DRAFT_365305 [Lineolata rhizophorae]|uniref:Uncharacterized protein n=1 Tax=Lineolata rhizophorae TaxID=578093 RepID=A0A6A6NUY9_9PEZI|nr:hypothetical protein BDY21DRAFT_365305 [Lineolata rhizophorae]